MKFKTNKNGKVSYLMWAGKDLVEGMMTVEQAQTILDASTNVKNTNNTNYPVCVDDKWFFPVMQERKKAKRVVEEPECQQEGE